jgi:hypothetical protein
VTEEPLARIEHGSIIIGRVIMTVALVVGALGLLILVATLLSKLDLWEPKVLGSVVAGGVLAILAIHGAWGLTAAWSGIAFELHRDRAVLRIPSRRTTEVPLVEGTRVEVVREDKEASLSRDNVGGYLFASGDGSEISLVRNGWRGEDLGTLWRPFMWVVEHTECQCVEGGELSGYLEERRGLPYLQDGNE